MNEAERYQIGIPELREGDPCVKEDCFSNCPIGVCRTHRISNSGEIRLDFSRCNLHCPFCWAVLNHKSKRWTPKDIVNKIECKASMIINQKNPLNIKHLRFTGGEPLFSPRRWEHLLEVFEGLNGLLEDSSLSVTCKKRRTPKIAYGRHNVKIQTNGVNIGNEVISQRTLERIGDFNRLFFTFEVSLKGTTENEFRLLSRPSSHTTFQDQINAVKILLSLEDQSFPLYTRVIVGIYHSEQATLVDPNTRQPLLLNPRIKNTDFGDISNVLKKRSLPNLRIAMEPIGFTTRMEHAFEKCKMLGIISEENIIEPSVKRFKKRWLIERGENRTKLEKLLWP